MTCDGHIDEKEIEEIQLMDKNTTYFGDMDVSDALNEAIKDMKLHGYKVIENLFKDLREMKLNTVQELLILEVTLRIIHADQKVDENELRFLKLLRGRLALHDEIIIERFGKDVLLFAKEYADEVLVDEKKYLSRFKLPDLKDMGEIDITDIKN